MKQSMWLLVLLTSVAGAVEARADEWAIVGAYDPDMTEAGLEARAPDKSPGITHEYHRLNSPDDGRDVSVFSIKYGDEGVRVRNLRKFAAAGLLAVPLDDPNDCEFEFAKRKDLTAEGTTQFYIKADAVTGLRVRANALAVEAQAASEAFDAAAKALAQAEADLATATSKQLAAHEAAHVVQQKAGVALREFQARPTRDRLNTLLAAIADLTKALQAVAAADAAVAEAESRAVVHRQEFGQAQAQKKNALAAAQQAADAVAVAEAEAESLRLAAGKSINADIAAATALAAEEAQGLAEALADIATFVSTAKASYGGQTGIGHPSYDHLAALEESTANAAALAARDAGEALKLAEAARQLPPIPQVASEDEAAKLPQSQVADALSDVAIDLAVNGMVLAMGAAGGSPLDNAINGARDSVRGRCMDGSCAASVLESLDAQANELTMLQLQAAMQNENRIYTTVSNVLKTKHDTAKNSVSNIR